MNRKIDRVFIVHYTPLENRKAYLTKQFKVYGIKYYEFFEEYNRDQTSDELVDKYYKYNRPDGIIGKVQKCITIAHIEIYKKIIENNYNSVLILEDDAILFDDFLNKFNSYMNCVPNDYDLLFINAGCGLHAKPTKNDQIWYKVPGTRTCCAYIITKSACEKILTTIVPFSQPIDHALNTQIKTHNLNVYWCEPNIVGDGSEMLYGMSYQK